MASTWDSGASTWDGGASSWDGPAPQPEPPPSGAGAVAYVAVTTYDGVNKFARAVAVNDFLGTARLVDSGGSSYGSIAELDEASAADAAAGYITQRTLYPDSWLANAIADALTIAGGLTLQEKTAKRILLHRPIH